MLEYKEDDANLQNVMDSLPALVLDGKNYDNEPYSLSRLPPSTLSVSIPHPINHKSRPGSRRER